MGNTLGPDPMATTRNRNRSLPSGKNHHNRGTNNAQMPSGFPRGKNNRHFLGFVDFKGVGTLPKKKVANGQLGVPHAQPPHHLLDPLAMEHIRQGDDSCNPRDSVCADRAEGTQTMITFLNGKIMMFQTAKLRPKFLLRTTSVQQNRCFRVCSTSSLPQSAKTKTCSDQKSLCWAYVPSLWTVPVFSIRIHSPLKKRRNKNKTKTKHDVLGKTNPPFPTERTEGPGRSHGRPT